PIPSDSNAAKVYFNSQGQLLFLSLPKAKRDTAQALLPSEQEQMARRIFAYTPFNQVEQFQLDSTQTLQFKEAAVRTFSWHRKQKVAGEPVKVTAMVDHRGVRSFDIEYRLPAEFAGESSKSLLPSILEAIYVIFLAVLVLVFLIKRLRSDQISIRSGILFGLLAGLGVAMASIYTNDPWNYAFVLLGVLFSLIFIGAFATILTAVGESVTRDLPRDRFESLEAINHGKLLFKPVGHAIVNGFLFAAVILGGIALVWWAFSGIVAGYVGWKSATGKALGWVFPGLALTGELLRFQIFSASANRLFLLPLLMKWLKRPYLAILLVSIYPSFFPFSVQNVSPSTLSFLIGLGLNLILGWLYFRFDFLTSFLAGVFVELISIGSMLILFSGLMGAVSGEIFLGAAVLLFIAGGYIVRYGVSELAPLDLHPDYVYRLAERERLQRELEIARDVQLNFLPRTTPKMPSLQIASICIPANEVGGDYFDFVQINEHKLGIIIGDVSGKGIPAAFYMTLTKGILKSLITENISPRQVLIKANELFYQNAKRGVFISLIYGIFDVREKTFTFVRAGHNPPIHWQQHNRQARFLMPTGIAIGLEAGDIFPSRIEERKVPFSPGDVFVFYTDGFSEAMDKNQQEFGEQRLVEVLTEAPKLENVHSMLEAFQNRVKVFSDSTLQHDDMTMIVVRIQDEAYS
ncbi:MAG: hypothetical protein D6814_08895, partial [Calditrichaeota bacterium]